MITVCLASIVGFIACSKGNGQGGYFSCKDAPLSYDTADMNSFVRLNGLAVKIDSSGLYYQIISSGYGAVPDTNSTIFVTYTGRLFDGTIFDSTTNPAKTGYVLKNLMKAWQIGLPKIQVGGRIKMVVPSSLGYGCVGLGTLVPSNTPIYYDVSLISIQ
jgi:FKBP-type peptidyl-prolyl cis-trans isomerase